MILIRFAVMADQRSKKDICISMDSSSSTGHTVAGIVNELDGAKRQCRDGAMHLLRARTG
jgi:hypothetical protein